MVSLSVEEARQLAHEAILKQLAEGVIVTDVVGTIKFVNEAAARIHGVARLDIKPNAYSDTYHLYREDGRPYPSHELPLARAVRGETVIDARWLIWRPDGAKVLAIGTAQPLLGPQGQRMGAILTLRDDTARAAAETSLRESETALRQALEALAMLAPNEADQDEARSSRANVGETNASDAAAAGQAKAGLLRLESRAISTRLKEILDQTAQMLTALSIKDLRQRGQEVRAAASALLTIAESLSKLTNPVKDRAA